MPHPSVLRAATLVFTCTALALSAPTAGAVANLPPGTVATRLTPCVGYLTGSGGPASPDCADSFGSLNRDTTGYARRPAAFTQALLTLRADPSRAGSLPAATGTRPFPAWLEAVACLNSGTRC